MKIRKIAVISLWAQDVEGAAHFYQQVLGLQMLPHHGPRPHFKVGETIITILKSESPMKPQEQSLRFPLLAFEVENLDEAVEHLKLHRVDLPWGIESDQDSRWVMFHDPAGNLLELAEFSR